MTVWPIFILFIISGLFNSFYGLLEIIPQRAEIISYDKEYIINPKVSVIHASRKSPYVFNLEGTLLHAWTNNVTFHLVFYEKLGGTFKRSFVELKYKMCDLISTDNFVYFAFKQFGLKCPIIGDIHLTNVTYTNFEFHYNFPFTEGKAEATFYHTDTKRVLGLGSLYLTIKQKKKN